jgi:hypothetical protein
MKKNAEDTDNAYKKKPWLAAYEKYNRRIYENK